MANRVQMCHVCASPVRADIEKRLDAGTHLRQLARETGHSRAALSRHDRKHRLRDRIEHNCALKNLDRKNRREVALWPDCQSSPPELAGRITVIAVNDAQGKPIEPWCIPRESEEPVLRETDIALRFTTNSVRRLLRSHPCVSPKISRAQRASSAPDAKSYEYATAAPLLHHQKMI